MSKTHYFLWALLGLFCLRVIGQLVAVLFEPPFLPPMAEWYSGLVPYPILLPIQIAIIIIFVVTCVHVGRGSGFFAASRPMFRRGVLYFGVLYLAAMGVRYVIRMAVYPDERWLGGTIPIFFHWVLAGFIILFAVHHRRRISRYGEST